MSAARPGRTTVGFAVAATIVVSLPVFLVGALVVEVRRDVALPAWVLGVAVALFWVAAACISTRAGALAERFGPRRLTAASMGTASISLLGLALVLPSWHWLLVWGAVGGLANGVQHPATNAQIVARVAEGRRGLAFGLKQAAVPVSTLSAGVAIPLIAVTVGWRWAFGAGALLSVVVLVAYLAVVRDVAPPRRRGDVPRMPAELTARFRVLAVLAFAGGAVTVASAAGIVTAAVDRGVSAGIAGLLLSAASVIGITARVTLGALVDRHRDRALVMSATLVVGGGVGASLVAVPTVPTLLVGAVFAAGLAGAWAGLFHYHVSRTAGPFTPRATGITQTGSYVGCAAGPALFGVVSGVDAEVAPWLAIAVIAVVGGIVGLVVARTPRPPLAGAVG